MKALTVRQPHANAILYTGKDIENRSRCINVSGTIALHAGGQVDDYEYLPEGYKDSVVLGAIIGVVDIVDCVEEHESPWFIGPVGYVLTNPRPLPKPIPLGGNLASGTCRPKPRRKSVDS